MKILMLSPHPQVRGPVPRHTPLLADALREIGHEVTLYPWGRHSDDEGLAAKVFGRSGDVLAIRRLLRSEAVDTIVVKSSHDRRALVRDLPLVLAIRRLVPAIVVQFHGSRSDLLVRPGSRSLKYATRALLHFADRVLVLSSQEKTELEQFAPNATVRVVTNAFVPSVYNGRGAVDASSPTILFAGRLLREKGPFDVVEAFERIAARRPCRLVIAGSGPDEDALRARVRSSPAQKGITLTGYLAPDEISVLYREAHVLALPTYWPEGFPTVIAEGMGAGLPIVTTATRGIADHLREGDNALFVPPRSPQALADAFERLLSDEALRNRMAIANREQVRAFAPPAAAETFAEALKNLPGRGG